MIQNLSYCSFLKKNGSGSVHGNLKQQYRQGNHKDRCRLKRGGGEGKDSKQSGDARNVKCSEMVCFSAKETNTSFSELKDRYLSSVKTIPEVRIATLQPGKKGPGDTVENYKGIDGRSRAQLLTASSNTRDYRQGK